MKGLRTIRFDVSDDRVFARAAGSGEWCVPGGFAFAGTDPEGLQGKQRQAFAAGFLSLESFGRATFATVADMDDGARARCVERLGDHLLSDYGAPGLDAAREAAEEEVAFAVDLCADMAINTLVTVERRIDEEGQIREAFRTVAPAGDDLHARIWDVVEQG